MKDSKMSEKEYSDMIWNLYADLEDIEEKYLEARELYVELDIKFFKLKEVIKEKGYDPEEFPFDDENNLIGE